MNRLLDEVRKTVRNPSRVLRIADPGARARMRRKADTRGPEWRGAQRGYASYEDYLRHQRSKLAAMDLSAYDAEFEPVLSRRLSDLGLDLAGKSVLCLAARLGTEVRAFHQHGTFAVGIDLEPGGENRHVLVGDFHALQWPDASVDVVYTNSLDHALHLDRVVAEVRRVLKPGGLAIIEVTKAEGEGGIGFGQWEATRWERATEVADEFVKGGFALERAHDFDEPWPGTTFLLR